MEKKLFRELTVRAYGNEAISKVDALRSAGVNLSELVINAIMQADIEKLTAEKK